MVYVKICGITNVEDAGVAVEAGADLLGFIFYPASPRYVAPGVVAEIVKALRAGSAARGVRTVGVFVDTKPAEMRATLEATGLDLAQLSGGEPPHSLELLEGRAFKGLRPGTWEEADADAEWYADLGPPDGPDLLLDTHRPGAFGGTGEVADWHIAAALAPRYRLLLAGGLTPDNVQAAIRQVRPWGVDVGSGVEATPGRKDHQKVRAFIHHAKHANDEPG